MKNGESWLMNPGTRDYEQSGGSPVIDKSLKMPIYFRTLVPRTRWMYAPDNTYGSDFWQYKNKQGPNAPSVVESIEQRALQPILDDGRALRIDVSPINDPRVGIQLNVTARDASGEDVEVSALRPIS